MTLQYEQPTINIGGSSSGGGPGQFVVGQLGTGAPFTSIQAAIDAAGERDIDDIASVIVLGGGYAEDINMLRGVTVIGLGGAQINGSVTFDLTPGILPEDTFSVLQNFVVEPPAGTQGIIITGVNLQTVILNSLLVNCSGATALEVSNTGTDGPGPDPETSICIMNQCQISVDDPSLRLLLTFGGLIASLTSFQGDPSSTGMSLLDGFLQAEYCTFSGLFSLATPAFTAHSFCRYESSAEAFDIDGFAQLSNASITAGASPAIISSGGTGGLAYGDITWAGPDFGFDPALFLILGGQAYVPSPAAAGGFLTTPTSMEDAIDRIVIALSTGVAVGGGIPPI